jgi:hypothetical protein
LSAGRSPATAGPFGVYSGGPSDVYPPRAAFFFQIDGDWFRVIFESLQGVVRMVDRAAGA